jgi:hypothetical protein
METQENSVDPVLQALSQSDNLELTEVVKQKDADVSTSLHLKGRVLMSFRLPRR